MERNREGKVKVIIKEQLISRPRENEILFEELV